MSYEWVSLKNQSLKTWARAQMGLLPKDKINIDERVLDFAQYRQGFVTYDLLTLNPYEDLYFLVVMPKRDDPCTMVVLGWATYCDVEACGGKMKIANLSKRAPPPLKVVAKVKNEEEEKKDYQYFYLPFRGPRAQGAGPKAVDYLGILRGEIKIDWELVGTRLRHIEEGGEMDFPLADPEAEYQSYLACMGIGHLLELHYEYGSMRGLVQEIHNVYEGARVNAEKKRLDYLMRSFTNNPEALLRLFDFNGFTPYLKEFMLREPTPLDQYFHWKRNSDPDPLPWVLGIFAEQVDAATSSRLPLHTFGMVHLTPADVDAWVKQTMVIDGYSLLNEVPPLLEECGKEMQMACQVIYDKLTASKDPNNRRRHGRRAFGMPPAPAHVAGVRPTRGEGGVVWDTDIGNIINILPPCLYQLMTTPAFPTNGTRRFLVYAFRDAGMPKEALLGWFEWMNKNFSKAGCTSLEKRFDFEYAWNQREQSAPSCSTIINEYTRSGNYDWSEKIKCPYVTDQDDVRDIEDITLQCRQESAPHLRFETKTPVSILKQNGIRRARMELHDGEQV